MQTLMFDLSALSDTLAQRWPDAETQARIIERDETTIDGEIATVYGNAVFGFAADDDGTIYGYAEARLPEGWLAEIDDDTFGRLFKFRYYKS